MFVTGSVLFRGLPQVQSILDPSFSAGNNGSFAFLYVVVDFRFETRGFHAISRSFGGRLLTKPRPELEG